MNDPHVVALHYAVKPGEGITYDNPPPLSIAQTEFQLELRDDHCIATMLVHCPTDQAARLLVKPFLKAWEIETALNSGGRPQLQYQFERAEVIDRNPLSFGSPPTAGATGTAAGHSTATAVGHGIRHLYPSPPQLRINADLETLWFRYSLYRDRRDSLIGASYFCYTYFKIRNGGEVKAARTFSISRKVLKKLSYLLNRVGDQTTARKMDDTIEWRPHTQRELDWIDAAVRALIRRVGEHTAGAPLRQITMPDLPPLA